MPSTARCCVLNWPTPPPRLRRRRCQVTLARSPASWRLARGLLCSSLSALSWLCLACRVSELGCAVLGSVLGHALLRPRACIHCLPGGVTLMATGTHTRNSRCIIELCGLVLVLHLVSTCACPRLLVGLSAHSRITAQSMKSRYLDGPMAWSVAPAQRSIRCELRVSITTAMLSHRFGHCDSW